jgi:integrase
LLHAAANPSPSVRGAWPARDVAIIATLATTGARAAELCGLTDSNIDIKGATPLLNIRLGAKRHQHRNVPLPTSTLDAIRTYQTERDSRFVTTPAARQSALFVRVDGSMIRPTWLYDLLARLTTHAGIDAPAGALPHALRHYLGTELAARKVAPSVIQQMLGHRSTVTTAIYTRLDETALTNALHEIGWLQQ